MPHARGFSGRYFLGHGRGFATGATVPSADVLYAIPFEQSLLIGALALHNKGSGDNSPKAILGLYTHNYDTGLPGELIFQSEEIGMTNGETGLKVAELTEAHDAGEPYWVVAVFSGDPCAEVCSCSLSSLASQEIYGNTEINATFPPRTALQVGYTFGTLPTVFPEGAGTSITIMALAVRGA